MFDREFGLGFCHGDYPFWKMPGWYGYSWGYHGDNGALYINADTSDSPASEQYPSKDFSSEVQFGTGDTVGVGLNVMTGKGIVTLNGKKKDIGKSHGYASRVCMLIRFRRRLSASEVHR